MFFFLLFYLFICDVLNHLPFFFLSVFKRGKSIPKLGAFHSFDIPEFYGYGANPDFIGTDALGMFSQPFVCVV